MQQSERPARLSQSLDEVQDSMKKTSDEGRLSVPAPAGLWAYTYQMEPPQAESRMALIRALVDEENGEAKRGPLKWTARLVVEPRVTHVLVVSDSPELLHEGNRKLQAELKASGVRFSVTVPMLVGGPGRS